MPSSSGHASPLSKRETVMAAIAVLAVVGVALLGYFLYRASLPTAEETAAQNAAEDVAKAENPFKSDNPLAEVEANPLTKVKAVLNPF